MGFATALQGSGHKGSAVATVAFGKAVESATFPVSGTMKKLYVSPSTVIPTDLVHSVAYQSIMVVFVFDSYLLFRKTEKSYNLPQNAHSDDTKNLFFSFCPKIKWSSLQRKLCFFDKRSL